jgi:hypothetical protein
MQTRHFYVRAVLASCALSACAAPDNDDAQIEQTVSPEQLLGDEQSTLAQPRIFGVGTSCSPNPCRNSGTCADQWLGYTCTCSPGFGGKNCEKNIPNSCGDGKVRGAEQCDPKAPGSSIWSCDATCKRTTIYTKCAASNDCASGQVCFTGLGFCTASCTTSSQCLAAPAGATHAVCPVELNPTGYGICIAAGCSTNVDCAPGLRCYVGGNLPYCAGCAASSTCL